MPASADPPLDPAAAQALARVRRLMVVSLLVTMLAIAVVLIVVGYRVSRSGESGAGTDLTAMLPPGARVIGTAVADGRIVITIEAGGQTEIRAFDLKTLKPAGRLRLQASP